MKEGGGKEIVDKTDEKKGKCRGECWSSGEGGRGARGEMGWVEWEGDWKRERDGGREKDRRREELGEEGKEQREEGVIIMGFWSVAGLGNKGILEKTGGVGGNSPDGNLDEEKGMEGGEKEVTEWIHVENTGSEEGE